MGGSGLDSGYFTFHKSQVAEQLSNFWLERNCHRCHESWEVNFE